MLVTQLKALEQKSKYSTGVDGKKWSNAGLKSVKQKQNNTGSQ